MIEDIMICKFVAEHQTLRLQEANWDAGILEYNCGASHPVRISMQAQLQMR